MSATHRIVSGTEQRLSKYWDGIPLLSALYIRLCNMSQRWAPSFVIDKTPRLREVRELIQGHTASKWLGIGPMQQSRRAHVA
jgi:hypothetical protein